MVVREDLINSAVSFLQDPAVADATMEKKIEFLESKKMTKEEIDEALRRQASAPASASAPAPNTAPGAVGSVPPTNSGPIAYPYTYNPPPLPERDWKDYFVMATVSVGVTYGLYQVAKRYIMPMIMPPTPESLEADKAALEAEFAKTEALVEQLASDTKALKLSEEKRAETFDSVIKDARQAVEAVQSQADERKQDLRLLKSHVETLQDLIPKSLQRHKESQDATLRDLQDEMKSLKQLISNRTRVSGVPPASAVPSTVTMPKKGGDFIPQIGTNTNGANTIGASASPVLGGAASGPTGVPTTGAPGLASTSSVSNAPASNASGSTISADPANSSPAPASAPPAIPAWQRQATK